MIVHILALARMVLNDNIFTIPKELLDVTHFRPFGRVHVFAVIDVDADMFPAGAVAHDAKELSFPANGRDFKGAIISKCGRGCGATGFDSIFFGYVKAHENTF